MTMKHMPFRWLLSQVILRNSELDCKRLQPSPPENYVVIDTVNWCAVGLTVVWAII